ncbi:MAG TPA: TerB family tellurite resistance protein [Planctomycetes bacterium]|nr:TerB family tellurite resistance protein [Planctomycetota bacterium]
MGELAIITLILVLTAVVMFFFVLSGQIRSHKLISHCNFQGLISRLRFPTLSKAGSIRIAESSALPDLRVFNCRVQPTRQMEDSGVSDAFTVQIAGAIRAPSDMHYTTLQVSITDVTDGAHDAKPVHSTVKQWQLQDSPVFCYSADIGKVPKQVTTLLDWTTVAQLQLDWLLFPHKGKRNLQLSISILSRRNGEQLACATCTFSYDNPKFGYMELQEKNQRVKTLAVALAFAVSAADGKLYDCEVELIKNWARDNFDSTQVSYKGRRKLERALNKTIAFFRDGNQLDTYTICNEIVDIAPLVERYDILDLCLHVARANGVAAAEEIALLKNLADWLEVDTNRFRDMVERTLPVGIHEVKDEEVILGLSSDMSKEKTRRQLNKQFCKWNSRVTNSNPEIQNQADQMLNLIAEARREYIGQDTPR